MENVVSEPLVMSSCLPISTTSISLVGLESRSTMLPASLAAVVPVFMATPTSAWARAGASLVPSPVMATNLPPSCSCLMSASFASGVASARKSSTPASWAMVGRGQGVVAGDHHRADAHGAHFGELLLDSLLHTSLSSMTPRMTGRLLPRAVSSPPGQCARRWRRDRRERSPPCSATQCLTDSAAPLRI